MKRMLIALCLLTAPLAAQQTLGQAKVTPLMSKDLAGIAGKEGWMATVEFRPGEVDAMHRHNANVFVYVLEGSVVMQLRGAKAETLGPGQTFYEGPEDIHLTGRNASKTKPAKLLVFFVKDKGVPPVLPAQ